MTHEIWCRYTWEIEWSNDKDALMAGNTCQGVSTVEVAISLDEDSVRGDESRLIAEMMVLCRGVEPTKSTLVAYS